ncbi:winged helix-turn-helix domain-containing protein [Roseicella aquatilis]|nr:response regulator transcription factor [Roseicella aquatilis]
MRVLLCSARPGPSELAEALEREGLVVTIAAMAESLAAIPLHAAQQDAVVIELAELRREEVLLVRGLRSLGLQLPLLLLCRAATADAEREASDAGADDVLVRHASASVISARLRATHRRCAGHPVTRVTCANVTLEPGRRQVFVDDRPVRLTAREFDVLEMLMLRRGAIQTKEYLLGRLYGDTGGRENRILDVFICKLRRKLAAAGAVEIIRTVWGYGYLAEAPAGTRGSPDLPDWARPEDSPGAFRVRSTA